MQAPKISLQSQHLLGAWHGPWHFLKPDEWDGFRLPSHLADQVFRIAMTRTASIRFFDVLVSEQFPKDAASHLAKSIAGFSNASAVINMTHGKSPNAHLIIHDAGSPSTFFHLDVDFAQLSQFDQAIIEKLQHLTPHRFRELIALTRGKNLGHRLYQTLRQHLSALGVRRESAHLALIDLLLKLVFLIFVQRKGWLNFDPFFLQSKMEFCHSRGLSILTCFFKPLFAHLDGRPIQAHVPLGELPPLGGGLFEFAPEFLPEIPNQWLLDLYRDVTSQYSFSLFEAQSGRSVLGVSPEILGHVFENLMLPQSRKRHGIYYTPREIAEKQVKASLQAYLKHHDLIRARPHRLLRAIQQMRVLDPSCGSGTYLVAVFQALLRLHLSLAPRTERYNGALFHLKRRIVCTNLFGVDIHPMAIRLTEVRLWLNMIQDLEVERPSKAPSLPSLQHHLRSGDFLHLEMPEDIRAAQSWPKLAELESLRRRFPTTSSRNRLAVLRHVRRLEREYELFLDRSRDDRHREGLNQGNLFDGLGQDQSTRSAWKISSMEPFRPHIVFSREFLTGGFDLIVGNPPWVRSQSIPAAQKARLSARLPGHPKVTIDRAMDLSLYFLLASMNLLKPEAHLSFLLPGKFLQAKYAQAVREHLFHHYQLTYLFDFGLRQRFVFRADTFPLVLGITRTKPKEDGIIVERCGKDVHQSFVSDREALRDRSSVWVLESPHHAAMRTMTRHWPRLSQTRWRISRGITTNAKHCFVFRAPPDFIAPRHLRPLLQGRDIRLDDLAPSAWIYWPFSGREPRLDDLEPGERGWLESTGKMRQRAFGPTIGYQPKPVGPWVLIWRYLALRWTVCLTHDPAWIPDQTTYYINVASFSDAFPLFLYFNSDFANQMLCALAERGKDGFSFFYAHTCRHLPIPPGLNDAFTRPKEVAAVYLPKDIDLAQRKRVDRVIRSEMDAAPRLPAGVG